jgi:hypothetical protein
MKTIILKTINLVLILILSISTIYAQFCNITVRNKSELMQLATYYDLSHLCIIQDSNLAESEKITDLSVLSSLEFIYFGIHIENTNIVNIAELGNINASSNGIISSLYLYNNKDLNDFSSLQNIKVGSIIIGGNDNIKSLDLNLNPQTQFFQATGFNELTSFNVKLNNSKPKVVLSHLNKLEAALIELPNDSIGEFEFHLNDKLKTIHFSFLQSGAAWPTTLSHHRKVILMDNAKLEQVKTPSNNFGYSIVEAKNNPMLTDLCLFKPTIKFIDSLGYADAGNVWANMRTAIWNNSISNNGTGASSADEIIDKDCIELNVLHLEEKEQAKFTAYPNPYAGGALWLEGIALNANVKVFDISGKLVQTEMYNGTAIYLAPLVSGLYLVQSQNEKGTLVSTKMYVE